MSTELLLRREIHAEVRIIDEGKGIVDYVASDETLDSYSEVIRAAGWRFNRFQKNAPFVDSHNYQSIGSLLGRVLAYDVMGGQLVERVQWAKDIPDTLAAWGWKMLTGGFLKAVSVGFYPLKFATRWDADKTAWLEQLKELNLHEEDGVRTVYIEQDQLELSSVIIGANPNAVARAYHAGALKDEDLDKISRYIARVRNPVSASESRGAVAETRRRAQLAILLELLKQA